LKLHCYLKSHIPKDANIKVKIYVIIVNKKGIGQKNVKRGKMNMLKEKLNQETLPRIMIKVVMLLFMHWLLHVKPMLGMWTLEHLHTCHIVKNGSKLMRASHW
jgi:hypothetical protein